MNPNAQLQIQSSYNFNEKEEISSEYNNENIKIRKLALMNPCPRPFEKTVAI